MCIALDLGSYGFRSLRRDGARIVGRSSRSVYAVLPDSDTQRQVLARAGIHYATCADHLILVGDAADEYAQSFQTRSIELLPNGRLPENDPVARQVIAALVECLLPPSGNSDAICCMTLPGRSADPTMGNNRELEFLTRLVKLRGYQPMVLDSGMAVVLAELAGDSYTGLGMSIGAAHTEIVVAHCGLEVARCVVPRGGDWIDEQFALAADDYVWDHQGNRFPNMSAARQFKHSLSQPLARIDSDRIRLLSDLQQDLLAHVVQLAALQFSETPSARRIPQPVNVVCAGGTTHTPGFLDLLAKTLSHTHLGVKIAGVRLASTEKYVVARGCLINAELEAQMARQQFAA